MKFWLTVLSTIILNTVYSQSNFGYSDATITYKKGDSIFCLVKREISYGDTITYKAHSDAEESQVESKYIKSIRFSFKYLENIKIGNKEKLTTQIVTGKIDLYNYVELQKGETVDVPNSNGGKFTPGNFIQHYIAKNGQGYRELVKTNFPDDLKQLINDCPQLILKINNQEYTFEDMPEIIKQYNSCKN